MSSKNIQYNIPKTTTTFIIISIPKDTKNKAGGQLTPKLL